MNFAFLSFPSHVDLRGNLIPIEFDASFPFVPKRVYFLTNTPPSTTRGAHCHHIEEEVFVCIAGKCRAWIDADGSGKKEIWLDSPIKAIYVGKLCWHEFDNFSEDAVLLCLSSVHYMPGESNYEYSYELFINLKNTF